ncbi:DUF302 domain-containing protein [Tropicimonas sp.]|uniref:DUF302 domain-containing protein n=1 Tax=Tropicimonas sp. TaxID=2067044 RepID=UPI003A873A80
MTMLGYTVTIDGPFDEAVETVTKALATEGFGVISRIDLDKAFAEKIGADFRRYTILGACNPNLALKAVTARPDIGLLLPCNVTVEQAGQDCIVRIVDAGVMMQSGDLSGTPEIAEVASDAVERLTKVAAKLG